jgi:hypothetical protein
VNDLSNYYTAIAGREYQRLIVNLHTAWLAEEGGYKEPKYEQEASHKPQHRIWRIKEQVYKRPYTQAQQTGNADYNVSLFVNLHNY